MDIFEREHGTELLLALRIKTARHFVSRILQRPKHPIENGQVRVVVRVPLALMMHAVRLGPLHESSEPVRRADVPVVEVFGYTGNQRVEARRRRTAPQQWIDNGRAQQRVEGDFNRVLVETGDEFDALRRVVQLMTEPPEQGRLMAQTVPPVINETGDEVGHARARPVREVIAKVQQELLAKAAHAGPGQPFGVVGLPKLPLLQPALWGFLTQRPFAQAA